MAGARRAGVALFGLAVTLTLVPVFAPVVGQLFAELLGLLPWYTTAFLIAGVAVFVLRRLLSLPLGRYGAERVVSSLVLDAIHGAFRGAFALIEALLALLKRVLARMLK